MKTAEELLRASEWGKTLSEDEIEHALAGIFERTFPAGAFICMKGEPVDAWMGMISGLGKMARRPEKPPHLPGSPAELGLARVLY